ncbi:MAG: hypothetical protein J7K26_03580 [Candidatus Aenigmarchaeota archaeon]|nr:hypothetical protein [Candidatus Aenigmarchaeota archaeon]
MVDLPKYFKRKVDDSDKQTSEIVTLFPENKRNDELEYYVSGAIRLKSEIRTPFLKWDPHYEKTECIENEQEEYNMVRDVEKIRKMLFGGRFSGRGISYNLYSLFWYPENDCSKFGVMRLSSRGKRPFPFVYTNLKKNTSYDIKQIINDMEYILQKVDEHKPEEIEINIDSKQYENISTYLNNIIELFDKIEGAEGIYPGPIGFYNKKSIKIVYDIFKDKILPNIDFEFLFKHSLTTYTEIIPNEFDISFYWEYLGGVEGPTVVVNILGLEDIKPLKISTSK